MDKILDFKITQTAAKFTTEKILDLKISSFFLTTHNISTFPKQAEINYKKTNLNKIANKLQMNIFGSKSAAQLLGIAFEIFCPV
jgi:hypothetical protein